MATVWGVNPHFPQPYWFYSYFSPSFSLISSPLLSNKHIPLPCPLQSPADPIKVSEGLSAYIPSTCQGSFLNK